MISIQLLMYMYERKTVNVDQCTGHSWLGQNLGDFIG